jgi:5,6,7,8-tetrahydromethanopterin hydro-lyase
MYTLHSNFTHIIHVLGVSVMSERIIMRTGEALVAGGPAGTAAEPEVIIGELDGPVGQAIATLTGDQVAGHTRVF